MFSLIKAICPTQEICEELHQILSHLLKQRNKISFIHLLKWFMNIPKYTMSSGDYLKGKKGNPD